jgi:hypothetical protein
LPADGFGLLLAGLGAGLGFPPAGSGAGAAVGALAAAVGALAAADGAVLTDDGSAEGGAAVMGGSTGGLVTATAAETSGVTLGAVLVAFQTKKPASAATATPERPSQTARLLRVACVLPQACDAVLEAAFCDCALTAPISANESPLELSTFEMRSALRGPASGAYAARSRAKIATIW